MARVHLALLGGIGILLSALGCAPTDPQAEGMPVDTRDNILEQGIIDCGEWPDTGFVQGSPTPITLVRVDGKPAQVDTANAYYVMQQAAAAAGVSLRIVSGFRSMADQQYLYSCYVNCNCNNCNLAAQPGYSNHQSGHALDLNTSEGGVLNWLNAHAGTYGFSRTVPSESWHWEWWGGGPGGGPCGGDPECIANPNHGGCSGTHITYCDDSMRLLQGDCGFYGAGCSTGGGKPHCVHFLCLSNLDGGENGTFCVDDSKIATCTWGAYEEGDCAVYGATCSEQGGAAHCVHFMCWSNLDGGEDGSFCVDGATLGRCALGAYEEIDCAAQGTACVEQGGGAGCQGATEDPPDPVEPEPTTPDPNEPVPDPTEPAPDPDSPAPDPEGSGDSGPHLPGSAIPDQQGSGEGESQGGGLETADLPEPAREGCSCAMRGDGASLLPLLLLSLVLRRQRAKADARRPRC